MNIETKIKTVQTRHNEEIILATTPEEMFGKYAAENINHVWHEDFVDEDKGEVVTMERKQLIFERGTYFDNRNIDSVRFHFEAGEFSQALVSNQCRIGNEIDHWGLQAYKVKVSINGKNNVIVCQARSLTMAHAIVKDWCELHLDKAFLIVSIAELSTGTILNAALKKREDASANENAEDSAEAQNAEAAAEEQLPTLEEEAAPDPNDDGDIFGGEELEKEAEAASSKKSSSGYYEVQLEIHYQYKDRDLKHSAVKGFLVEAKDADAARDVCFGYIDMTREDNETVEEIRIISASPFSCYKVIEREFTAAYIDAERNETQKSNE